MARRVEAGLTARGPEELLGRAGSLDPALTAAVQTATSGAHETRMQAALKREKLRFLLALQAQPAA